MSSKNKSVSDIDSTNNQNDEEIESYSENINNETTINDDDDDNDDSNSLSDIEDEECDYTNLINKFDPFNVKEVFLKGKDRITNKFLTKYEYVRLIEDRATQLNLESKPMIKNINGLSSREIAMEEIKQKVIPLKIIRNLPNGLKEEWKIDELVLKKNYI